MIIEVKIDEKYSTVGVFDMLESGNPGDVAKVPYEESRHTGIKQESQRRNMKARLLGEIGEGRECLKYKVYAAGNDRMTMIFRLV